MGSSMRALRVFGGEDIHAAIAWHQERVVFGPRFTQTPREAAEPHYQSAGRPRKRRPDRRQMRKIRCGSNSPGNLSVVPTDLVTCRL